MLKFDVIYLDRIHHHLELLLFKLSMRQIEDKIVLSSFMELTNVVGLGLFSGTLRFNLQNTFNVRRWRVCRSKMSYLGPKWVSLTPKRTNL